MNLNNESKNMIKKNHIVKAAGILFCLFFTIPLLAQVPDLPPEQLSNQEVRSVPASPPGAGIPPTPILIEEPTESLDERLTRTITLDVREMNIIDVLKFLALKGDFNMVTSSKISGRVTLYLKSVKINDALDIILISNGLGYHRQKDIIHVVSQAEYEAMFGKKFNDQNEVRIVRLQYAKPSYVLATLDSIKSSLGKVIIDEDTGQVVMIDTPEVLDKMQEALVKMEAPLETYIYSLQYAKADVVTEKLKSRIEPHAVGSIAMDERSNKLIIRALPERREELEKIIKDLDVATKAVLVEARVLQVVFKPQYDVGIDWEFDIRDAADEHLRKLNFKNVYLDNENLSSSDNLASTFFQLGMGDINVDHLETKIRSLKQVSDTKILSHPKILVTNNEEAKIHVGDTIPYIISTTSGTGDNAITSEDVRFVDVGIRLNVTPKINDDGVIIMKLEPEISTVVARITSQGGGIPQVNKTFVTTTAMVKDGTTIILGGLIKDNKVHTKKGFPILMDIPYLDKFFSRTSDSVETTEIVILITPHIVKSDDDYFKLKGDIKSSKPFEASREGAGVPMANDSAISSSGEPEKKMKGARIKPPKSL